jgi:hypothetical protein
LTQEQLDKTGAKMNQSSDDQYYPLFKDFDGLNMDHFRRKRAYQTGEIKKLDREYTKEGSDKDSDLRGFWDMLDILPVVPK